MMQLEFFADVIQEKVDGSAELKSMLQSHEVIEKIIT
jgi:hypothetical protein